MYQNRAEESERNGDLKKMSEGKKSWRIRTRRKRKTEKVSEDSKET